MLVYKVLRDAEWRDFQRDGATEGAPVDLADGYIHFSTAETLQGTLDKHFAGEDGLWLLACEADTLGAKLKWEESRGGLLFPHLYRALSLADVAWWRALPLGPDGHEPGVAP